MLHRTSPPLLVAALATAALVGSTATATSAVADTQPQGTWQSHYDRWNDSDDDGGVSISESRTNLDSGEYVSASFQAYGEILKINDRHSNGRSAVAKLWIGGNGPAIYYGNGDGTSRTVNLSYDEGQSVHLQVCTSDSPNAECTAVKPKSGTT